MWEPVQVASAASSTSSTHLPSGSSSRSWISGEEGLLIVRGRQASSPTPERSPTPVRGMMEERIEESHVNVNNHPGLPSPPSSLEESSAPSSPSGQEEEKEPKSKVVKSSKPKKITGKSNLIPSFSCSSSYHDINVMRCTGRGQVGSRFKGHHLRWPGKQSFGHGKVYKLQIILSSYHDDDPLKQRLPIS